MAGLITWSKLDPTPLRATAVSAVFRRPSSEHPRTATLPCSQSSREDSGRLVGVQPAPLPHPYREPTAPPPPPRAPLAASLPLALFPLSHCLCRILTTMGIVSSQVRAPILPITAAAPDPAL